MDRHQRMSRDQSRAILFVALVSFVFAVLNLNAGHILFGCLGFFVSGYVAALYAISGLMK